MLRFSEDGQTVISRLKDEFPTFIIEHATDGCIFAGIKDKHEDRGIYFNYVKGEPVDSKVLAFYVRENIHDKKVNFQKLIYEKDFEEFRKDYDIIPD